MTYEDVTYALDAAGTVAPSLPSNSATRLVAVVEVDGVRRECTVREVTCTRDSTTGELVVQLLVR